MLDLCVDAADSFIGIVSVEPNELMPSSARVYEVGRRRVQVSSTPQDFGCGLSCPVVSIGMLRGAEPRRILV